MVKFFSSDLISDFVLIDKTPIKGSPDHYFKKSVYFTEKRLKLL